MLAEGLNGSWCLETEAAFRLQKSKRRDRLICGQQPSRFCQHGLD